MKVVLFGLAASVLALICDNYIYRRFIRDSVLRWWWKNIYLWFFTALDLTALIGIVAFRWTVNATPEKMHILLWITAIFYMNLAPKFVFCFFSWCDSLTGSVFRRYHILRWIGGILALYFLGEMIWGITEGRQRLEIKELTIASAKLPEAFDGVRIAFFSDIHLGNLLQAEKMVKNLVATINSLDPDYVVNGGDLVNIRADEITPALLAELSRFESPVFSVWGNHDIGFYIFDSTTLTPSGSVAMLRDYQRRMGWRLLEDETVYLHRGGDSIAISGVGYPPGLGHMGGNSLMAGVDLDKTYRNLPDSVFNIMIAHTPHLWDEIRACHKSTLTLSGHVHAMQMKVRLFGREFSPAQFMYPRWSGLYREDDDFLYVNDGIGYVTFPMRVNTYPEITLITLTRCE